MSGSALAERNEHAIRPYARICPWNSTSSRCSRRSSRPTCAAAFFCGRRRTGSSPYESTTSGTSPTTRHHTTDDVPYGGGGGMVLKPEPVFEAVETVLGLTTGPGRSLPHHPADASRPRVQPSDRGRTRAAPAYWPLSAGATRAWTSASEHNLATDEISIGDYVLTGGELPALIVIDAVARLLPGALGDPDGAATDSHAEGLLEHPHFTRPPEFRGARVPDVLLSGDHAKISQWRRQESLRRTIERRPDLLKEAALSPEDIQFLVSQGLSLPD